MNTNPVLNLSWDDFYQHTLGLANLLTPHGPFVGIVAIARGGLVPGAILAQRFKIRHIETVCLASYDDVSLNRSDLVTLKPLSLPKDGQGWIVVDDLVDTGKTFELVRNMLPKAHFACIYAKPVGEHAVDTFARPVAQDTWITFPWEG